MMTTANTKTVDRAALRAEWAAMRADFLALADALSDAQWRQPSGSTDWTNGELLTHFVIALGLLPGQLAAARSGKPFGSMLGGILHPFSYWLTRFTALAQRRAALKTRFERDYAAGLRLIDGVRDDEWSQGAPFFGGEVWDVETVCRRPVVHWQEHGTQVRQGAGLRP